MTISAVIVIYNPEIPELIRNIRSLITNVDRLILYQNTLVIDELETHPKFKEIPKKGEIVFLGDGTNVGIATALNAGVGWSLENQFTHILTLDQDSHFREGHLARYKDLIKAVSEKSIGIFGINPNSWGRLLFKPERGYKEVSDTITSGSVFPLTVFKDHGGFEDDLFIDAVDYEYCYRLKTNGLKTVVFTSIILEHKVGNAYKTWLGFKTDNYSAFRTYYIIRNHIIMWKRYKNVFPKKYKINLIKIHIIVRLIKIILGEGNKMKKMCAIVIGAIHGVRGRTGFYKI